MPSKSSQRRLDALAATVGGTVVAGGIPESPRLFLVPPTPFIGREAELDELEGLLKANRLVTLTGPGESGKARLAMELIRRSTRPQDPVTLVALDVIRDPELVASAVCAALDLRDAADISPEELLISHLATSPRLLLLLDNCEHVIEAVCRLVGAALTAAPELQVLATSRIVLKVAGEKVWAVPPLELAAAWSAVLSPTELAGRLEDGFALLDCDGGSSGRHRTLRATVEWSDALLDPEDREMLGRLSVFAGRFTISDAEVIGGVAGGRDTVVTLRRLVDSSWVVAEPGEETTYALLNTLRSYRRELLERGGQAASVRRRHGDAFTALPRLQKQDWRDQARWRTRMEQATGDIGAALEWAVGSREIEVGLRLVASLWRWWYTTGRIVEGRRWASAALRRSRPAAPSLRAQALYASAMLASENGDYATAAAHAISARREFDAIGDHRGAARSSTVLGNVAKYRGDVVAARAHLTAAVVSQRTSGDDWGTAVALQNLASLAIDQGDLSTGRTLMEESLALKRRAGDRRSLGYGLINLSDLLVREHRPEPARSALAEAASIAVALGDDRLAAFVEHNLRRRHRYRRPWAGRGPLSRGVDTLPPGTRSTRRGAGAVQLGPSGVCRRRPPGGAGPVTGERVSGAEIGDELRLAEARSALGEIALPPAAGSLPGGLTARQAEILALATGLSNRDIATRLSLSVGTVERHLANLYTKLGVHNRVAATRYALAHGLGAPSGT